MFQREIYVPFIQTYLWYQLQAFAAYFRKRELICTNSKHDYEAKLTSLNCFPFNQTVNRPVCPCKMENNQQLCMHVHHQACEKFRLERDSNSKPLRNQWVPLLPLIYQAKWELFALRVRYIRTLRSESPFVFLVRRRINRENKKKGST